MKTVAINLSFKLLILTSFIVSGNLAMASGDIVECQPVLESPLAEKTYTGFQRVEARIQCGKESFLEKELNQTSLDELCRAHAKCNSITSASSMNESESNNLIARFLVKKKLQDELPRSMVYGAVKDFLEKEKAFPENAQKDGEARYNCSTTGGSNYSIQSTMGWLSKHGYRSTCSPMILEEAGYEHYSNCGANKQCFGDLDNVLGESKLLKASKKTDIEGYIKNNTEQLITHYNAQTSDTYVEEIRLALLANESIDTVLKKYRDKSPVLMALYMSGQDRATVNILADLQSARTKQLQELKNAKSKSAEEFKAIFKKVQISLGQAMFSNCNNGKKFFPWNPAKLCEYTGKINEGKIDIISLEKYSKDQLLDFYKDLNIDIQNQGYDAKVTNYLLCRIKTASGSKDGKPFSDAETSYYRTNNMVAKGAANYSSSDPETGSGALEVVGQNSAIDSDLNNALINQAKMEFSEKDKKDIDENAVIQANNQNLRGQNSVDSQAFINNFQPIDNYSGLTNEYVNKSYINRADKLKADKETSTSSDSSLNKQYSDIEAKIAEAEARLKELQQGFGEVGKNAKNQPVVSNGAGKEKTQTSSEIEELLKEIKELKAQNNEIKEKLVAKASSEKAEKEAEKNQSGAFSNSSGLAFSSGNKNDYKYESKPVEIKPTSSYSSSAGSSQGMRAPSSLGAAKLGSQSSGAILSAVDSKADAVNPARAVTRVDSFNSESARRAITSRINEINKNTKEMEQNKATIEIDGQLKEVISFEVLDEKGKKKLVVVELKDGKVVVDKDGNPIYVSQDMTDDSIIITKKGKDEKSVKKLQSQADVKRVDELKLQKGRSAERVKLNDLTRSAVKEKP